MMCRKFKRYVGIVALAVFVPLTGLPVMAQAQTIQQRVASLEAAVAVLQVQNAVQAARLNNQLTQNIAQQAQINSLQSSLAAVQANNVLALGPYVSVDPNEINGLSGPHILVTGANVHIRSGSGATNGNVADPVSSLNGTVNGLGNLIVGYNEVPTGGLAVGDRQGSHNIVIGPWHRYSSFVGFVTSFNNTISGPYASVSGGSRNTASGSGASVSGGGLNTASGSGASVSGGSGNTASGGDASVSGGNANFATGGAASISGGNGNVASASFAASISGGSVNVASGPSASIGGGRGNVASGFRASVSGGQNRSATGDYNWAAGALSEPN